MGEMDRRVLLGAVGAVGAAGFAAMARAGGGGPLNPPGGAVSATGKTLDQVEPRVVVETLATGTGFRQLAANAYKLTSNTDVPLEFGARVDLDLCGFRVAPAGSVSANAAFAGASMVVVRNGFVSKRFFFNTNAPNDSIYENVVFENADVYIGNNSVVRNCVFAGCRLFTGSGCLIESCVFRDGTTLPSCAVTTGDRCRVRDVTLNSTVGGASASIIVGASCIVESCRANTPNNAAFRCGAGSLLIGCTAEQGVPGFDLGPGSSAVDCAVESFSGAVGNAGFILGAQASAERCRTRQGNAGFTCGEDALLRDCVAFAAAANGFNCTGAGVTIEGCTARNCGGIGFALLNSSRIERCIAVANTGGGIQISTDTLCRNNHGDSNGVFGLRITGSDNRVEGNSMTDSATGIEVQAGGNLVIGNSVAGSTTPFNILAGNAAGPIIGTAGVSTNTVSTANFSF